MKKTQTRAALSEDTVTPVFNDNAKSKAKSVSRALKFLRLITALAILLLLLPNLSPPPRFNAHGQSRNLLIQKSEHHSETHTKSLTDFLKTQIAKSVVESIAESLAESPAESLSEKTLAKVANSGEQLLKYVLGRNFRVHSTLQRRKRYDITGSLTFISPLQLKESATFIQGTFQLEDPALGQTRDSSIGLVRRKTWGKGIIGHAIFYDKNNSGHQRIGLSFDYQRNKQNSQFRLASNTYLPMTAHYSKLNARGSALTHSYVLPGYDLHIEQSFPAKTRAGKTRVSNIRVRLSYARWYASTDLVMGGAQKSVRLDLETHINQFASIGTFYENSSYESDFTELKTMQRRNYGLRLGITLPPRPETKSTSPVNETANLWSPVKRESRIFLASTPSTDTVSTDTYAEKPVVVNAPSISVSMPETASEGEGEISIRVRREGKSQGTLHLAVFTDKSNPPPDGHATFGEDYTIGGLEDYDSPNYYLDFIDGENKKEFYIHPVRDNTSEPLETIRLCFVLIEALQQLPTDSLCESAAAVTAEIKLHDKPEVPDTEPVKPEVPDTEPVKPEVPDTEPDKPEVPDTEP
ncbi:MAG: inverse autotransporter beta domain-containing protein, partial [Alphaproteobacteria bacterium]